jgi:NAD(P)-dependent dehydrogenase (short-subunit alcohol dehydrogenase family)
MKDFAGKVAVVTGGASGIGRAIAERFAREGVKLVLADVEPAALERTVAEMRAAGHQVTGVVTDVRKLDSVKALAAKTVDSYGGVQLLFNNAGVGTDETRQMLWQSPENDWRWVLDVNLFGVLNGIKAFVPGMLERGEEAYVVNTSSGNGGLFPLPTTPIYASVKAAVTCVSEVLHAQLQMTGAPVKAGVLFPGPHLVRTNIFTAYRNRPADVPYETEPDAPPPTLEEIRGMIEGAGLEFAVTEPADVAELAFQGIREDRFWLLPASEETDGRVRERLQGILARENPPLRFM